MRAKPANPVWQPGLAPAGCALYLPLALRGNASPRDYSGRGNHASLVGSPASSDGACGNRVGGFSSSNYLSVPHNSSLAVAGAVWLAALVDLTTASPADFEAVAIKASSGSWADGFGIFSQFGKYNFYCGAYNSNPALGSAAVGVHVLMGVWTPSATRFFFDGKLAGTASSPTPTPADNTAAVVAGYSVGGIAFTGRVYALAAGTRAYPDPARLAADWLSGAFAAVRPRTRVAALRVAPPAVSGGGRSGLSGLSGLSGVF